ncbi:MULTISPECIES: ExbD/TolR family protein [unclassified Novosphingobium]|uniref:ExbD/TolR family protein n=1 Tax=unclassified Novosphingobium TaxID=2644732 RepID=UPI0008699792|nr:MULTISPECIES: biopolymer transporter ExbD [unclassified Novosphingobium]MBN9145885.1 biopolymer transporter ExbD [Novosphingobium sp.]NKI99837.1 biopolymer transport protein ExbD [Novosphingobium sp. SG707]ODU81259.1 MAG: biopolymer transporter ExbD [Novosphingobium sp. SCN 63-17]OJX95885.1 MAG: biopolymer transporter ExbD [Novosphingobium sp. 63-713]
MAMSAGKDDGEPMSEMNTTPLIDVMLVLLIMFIITIPVATHAVNIDLPSPPPPNMPKPPVDPIKNKVVLTPDNQILWNGTPIDRSVLAANLKASRSMTPEPELQFEPDAQSGYELAANVLNIIKASEVTKFGFVGNERYATFNKAAGAK